MNAKSLLFCAALPLLAGAAAAQGFAGMGSDHAGYAEVTPGRVFAFPQDHGAHPGFRTEWWYLTANLKDAEGNSYGAQWTLFRQATEPGPERDGWASQIVWMGHAAFTSASQHFFAETFARGGVGQAGVTAEPFRAFIDDWAFAQQGADAARLRVTAKGAKFRYGLDLAADKPNVLQGEAGFSRKSPQGQASYYYSQPFFAVAGTLLIEGREIKVTGRAWMDREWTSQYLAADQKGWDWFSLHLAGGEKVMLFRMRNEKGPPFCAGTWIGADGKATPLARDDVAIEPLAETTIGARHVPTRWRIKVAGRALAIETTPLNPRSFNASSFPYWEGPIRFDGSAQGEGYLEMTGY